ncbi:hypothetical protein GGS24DRAFT_494502 [Hypoxylon argillaceum]|nr:hypothetical protein GGS24DRAFT_494502 [Hypoxylon argillaceum]
MTRSQYQGIAGIPDEIVLSIVEYMDTTTRKCFMATNKGMGTLIESYEHSISKTRAATFILPSLGNILSSSTDERCVLPKDTFSMIHELELRDERIDRLIKECPKVFSIASPPWLPSLMPPQQGRLVMILKRALYQCDRIADIAANEPCIPIPVEYYHSIVDGVYELPFALSSPIGGQFNPLTRLDARPKQIEYIRSLSLDDIAGVFVMINMVGYGLMVSSARESPARFERKTVIEECVLRHGTWFLWSRLLGGLDSQEFAGCIISAGRAELRQWESGSLDGPPGLKMTLIERFKELMGGNTEENTSAKIVSTLEKLVLGGNKKPTEKNGFGDARKDVCII